MKKMSKIEILKKALDVAQEAVQEARDPDVVPTLLDNAWIAYFEYHAELANYKHMLATVYDNSQK